MAKILITGASGLIGKRLTEILSAHGHQVSHLGRTKRQGVIPTFCWDIEGGVIEQGALDGVDTIIHLAGAGVADKRWTAKRKKEVLESRTHSTRLLFEELKKGGHNVSTFISASAIGYYGFEGTDHLLVEDDKAGKDFLAQVVYQWENEVDKITSLGLRVVKIRIGIVLSRHGGALAEMAKPVKFYVGSPLGTGEQSISWIHIDDLCAMFEMAVKNVNMHGAYNGVGPYPVTNRELTKAIAKVMGKPILLPAVPEFVLRIIFGEMADIVLRGSRVSDAKIVQAGFKHQYTTLEQALAEELK